MFALVYFSCLLLSRNRDILSFRLSPFSANYLLVHSLQPLPPRCLSLRIYIGLVHFSTDFALFLLVSRALMVSAGFPCYALLFVKMYVRG